MSQAPLTSTAAGSPDLGQALGALLRAYHDGAREVLHELPGGPRGYQVMLMSADQACSNQGAMARELGLDRTVMTYLVDDLEQAGLVERQADPRDRRARRVLITAAGRQRLESTRAAIDGVEQHVLAALDPAEIDLLRGLLAKVVREVGADVAVACAGDAPGSACGA